MPLPRILVVEDENIVAMDIERRLTRLGYDVVGRASRGHEAIEKAGRTRPDLALMDIRLKGEMGGIEAADTIRKQFSIPVVFLTAYADDTTLHRAKSAEPYGYLLKPFNEIELRNVIEVALHKFTAVATAHAQTMEALWKAEEQLKLFVGSVRDYAIFMLDARGMILTWNSGAERIKGYQPHEVIGKHFSIFYPPEAIERETPERALRTAAAGSHFQMEGWRLRKDGSRFWADVIITPIRDKEGNVRGFGEVTRDITERMQAEEKLRESQRFLRSITEASPHFIYIFDLELMRVTYENRPILGELGHPPSASSAEEGLASFGEFLAPGELPHAAKLLDEWRALPDGQLHEDEYHLRHADGSTHSFAGREVLFARGADGAVRQILGTLADVTQRNRAEEKARRSEELFGKAFRASPAAILFSSLSDGRLIEVNDAFVRMFGFENREQIIGRTGLELGLWENPADRDRIRQAAQQKGSLRDVEAGFRRHSGELGHALASIELVELRGEQCVLSLFHDITARKRAEADLQHSLALLTATLESTDDGILALDIEGNVVSFNQRFADLWRIPAEVVASHDYHRVLALAVEQLRNPDAFLKKAPESNMRAEPAGSDTLQFKDGRVLEHYSHPQRLGDQTVGHVWSFRDVTQRRRLEDQLRQVQKMESVGQLAAGIAHDFNNLLTVIQCNCDLLRAQLADRPQSAGNVQEIAVAGERAASLTRQLLLFSRKEVAQRRLVDLNELTGNLIKMLGRILGEDIALRLECLPGLPPVDADPGMIEQVITNLSVNARDAMPEGGRLEIATSVADLDAVRALSNPEAKPGRFVCLTVSDTGSGMAPEIVSKIYEPFFTTKEVGKGTGLGLATVYGIVMQHQGVIEVTSQLGEGSSFRIFLPASASRAEDSAAEVAAAAPTPGGSETILLVEDEAVVLRLLQLILTRAGYTVLAATSGPDAQQTWQEHHEKIDMLMTDMVMPGGFSGKQLAEKLKAQNPALRVIFMSGYSQDLRNCGMDIVTGLNFIQKPFSRSAILQVVRRQLDSRG